MQDQIRPVNRAVRGGRSAPGGKDRASILTSNLWPAIDGARPDR